MRLVLRFDGQDVQEFVLEKTDVTIGRTPDNDISIDNLAISSHHRLENAEIFHLLMLLPYYVQHFFHDILC